MEKKYFAVIILCFVITGVIIIGETVRSKDTEPAGMTSLAIYDTENSKDNAPVKTETVANIDNNHNDKNTTHSDKSSHSPNTQKHTAVEESKKENVTDKKAFKTVDSTYLDDALFIGDSRTVGIMEYGGVEKATFFASTGLSVFKLDNELVSVKNVGRTTFSDLIGRKKYGKIYLMLGINEAGYPFESIKNKYSEVVKMLTDRQPDATIYLCANLHVTKKNEKELINNALINKINNMISDIATENNLYYIDVNEIFDDRNGNLNQSYSNDNVHILAKYYRDWIAWICTKGVE